MSIKHYIIVNGMIEVEEDFLAWAEWFETDRLHYHKITHIACYEISTIFLGLNHNFLNDTNPILWETMVFDISGAGLVQWAGLEMERCAGGVIEATAMHKRVVDKVQHIVDNPDLYPHHVVHECDGTLNRDDVRAVQQDGACELDDDACAEQSDKAEGQTPDGDPHEEGPL